MPYANVEHLRNALSPNDFEAMTDRDADGVLDAARVTQALEEASALADSYIAQYLPLTSVPASLRGAVLSLAIAQLAGDGISEQQQTNRKQALVWLRDIGRGTAQLAVEAGTTATSDPDTVLVDCPRDNHFGGDGLGFLP